MPGDFKLTGGKAFDAALASMTPELKRKIQSEVIDTTGLGIMNTIKDLSVRGNPTGETTQKYSPRRTHTASAPGQPPAVDTGRLIGQVTFRNTAPLTAEVTSVAVQAFALEFGRQDGSILPRPAWVPAVEKEEPKFARRLETTVAGVIK